MSFVNQVILIGSVSKEPKVKKVTDKGKLVRVELVTTEEYQNAKGDICEDRQWHTVYFNNKLGNAVAEYIHQGDKMFVSGKLFSRDWHDEEGVKHTETAIYAQVTRFFSKKTSDTSQQFAERTCNVSEILRE